MQLNVTTDYAIRVVLCLRDKDNLVQATTISKEMCIPQNYLNKILKKLRDAGYISSVNGVKGGYYLNYHLSEITFGDIYQLMEPTIKINRCLEDDCFCSRNASSYCQVRKFYLEVQSELEKKLFHTTLQSILEND